MIGADTIFSKPVPSRQTYLKIVNINKICRLHQALLLLSPVIMAAPIK
jgi:hypothetical protein